MDDTYSINLIIVWSSLNYIQLSYLINIVYTNYHTKYLMVSELIIILIQFDLVGGLEHSWDDDPMWRTRIFQRGLKPPASDNWMIKSELKCSYAKYAHDFLRLRWVCLTVESRIFTLHSMVNSWLHQKSIQVPWGNKLI